VEWGCYAQAGGVEESEFFLQSVSPASLQDFTLESMISALSL
jgi:hypothetical protein